jgi:energy-coupling factor transporter ATP-binding protein EcfA2
MSVTSFRGLQLDRWRQFAPIQIDLDSRVTVITGANGAGKTTILSLLGYHFSWDSPFVGGRRRRGSREFTYEGEDGRLRKSRFDGNVRDIGSLTYQDGTVTDISVPSGEESQFRISFESPSTVDGFFLNSHRPWSGYQLVNAIPAQFAGIADLHDQFAKELREPFLGRRSKKSARLVMKESLLAAAVYGETTNSLRSDNEARDVWHGFQRVLEAILPKDFGFRRLIVEPPEIYVQTGQGEFPLDALSGGLSAVFELAWQVFLHANSHNDFTVCFDEPENHLHPSLQRSLVPSLMDAFPNMKLVVATHSPFVVTSHRDANVVVLDRDSHGEVDARSLDIRTGGVDAESTLRNVLDVSSTLPIWANLAFEEIMSRHVRDLPSANLMRSLRDELISAGLVSEIPSAMHSIADGSKQRGRSDA